MGVIETLLNSNFSTVVSFIVAGLALAFIWYVALPKMAELSEVKKQLAEAQQGPAPSAQVEEMVAAVTLLAASVAEIKTSLNAFQSDSRRRHNDSVASQDTMLTTIAEVRHQVATLGQHVISLSGSVNTAIHRGPNHDPANGTKPPHGFRGLR